MFHRLAAIVVAVATVGMAACAPPSPPSGYVPCAIERPALGAARLPTHLVGLPDTVDELFYHTPVDARPVLPPSDLAVRLRLEMDRNGRARAACVLDPLEPRLARAFVRTALAGGVFVSPAVPPRRSGDLWIEDRVVWLRRARPLEAILREQPWSGSTGPNLEARALSDRAAFLELGRIGSPESLAAYDRLVARLESAVPAPARLDALDPGDRPSWLPETRWRRWSLLVPAADVGGMAFRLTSGATGRMYLAQSLTPDARDSWSRPVPVDASESCCTESSSLEMRDGALSLTCRSCVDKRRTTKTSIRPDDVFRDADGDRWTDVEERLLSLDPERADTDGDGVADGADVCPTLPVSAAVRDDDELVVQAAFIVLLGTTWPSQPLVPTSRMPRVHFRGYAGPILFGPPPSVLTSRAVARLEWEVVNRRGASAIVRFSVWEVGWGTQTELTVYMRLHGAKWYAVAVNALSWHLN